MEQVESPRFYWRIFALMVLAVFMAMAVMGSVFSGIGFNWHTAKGIYWLTALVGLTGYAFGFRLFSVTFWRFYAAIFTIEIAIRCLKVAWIPVWRLAGWPEQSPHATSTVFMGLSLIGLVCIALLRHAELIGPGRGAAR